MFKKYRFLWLLLAGLLAFGVWFNYKMQNPEVMEIQQGLDCIKLKCTVMLQNNHKKTVPFEVSLSYEAQGQAMGIKTKTDINTNKVVPVGMERAFYSIFHISGELKAGEVRNVMIDLPLETEAKSGQVLMKSTVFGLADGWFEQNGESEKYFAIGAQSADEISYKIDCGVDSLSVTIANKLYSTSYFSIYVNEDLVNPWQTIMVGNNETAKVNYDNIPAEVFLLEVDATDHKSSSSEYHTDRAYCVPSQLYHPSTTP